MLEIGEHATAFETQSAVDNLMGSDDTIKSITPLGMELRLDGYFVSDTIKYVPPMRGNTVAQQSFSSGSGGRFTATAATSSTIHGTTIYASPGSAGGNSGYYATWSADADF